jgi:hypothetical protein
MMSARGTRPTPSSSSFVLNFLNCLLRSSSSFSGGECDSVIFLRNATRKALAIRTCPQQHSPLPPSSNYRPARVHFCNIHASRRISPSTAAGDRRWAAPSGGWGGRRLGSPWPISRGASQGSGSCRCCCCCCWHWWQRLASSSRRVGGMLRAEGSDIDRLTGRPS